MYIKAILLSVLLVLSFSYEEEGNVLVLHDADFPQVLNDFPFILIEFYAPWSWNILLRCGHCQKLAPIFTEVADELKAQGSEGKW
jgi:thiol-disulfide isomerase/thioredoxin